MRTRGINLPAFWALVLLYLITIPSVHAQLGGTAGAFSRLGFGARGQGMGNAMSTVTTGTVSTYYNPALSAFQVGHVFYGTYSFLSLDRKLNEISYTQGIRILKKGVTKYTDEPGVQSIAGFSAGWINAGDANVQGYDNDGFMTKSLSVFENEFYFNFGTRFSDRIAGGFTAKFYYSGLYEKVTSSAFGIDLGILYLLNDRIHLSLVAQDLLTKYKWDTSDLYGPERGNTTDNPFSRIIRVGCGYLLPDSLGTVAAECEMYDGKTYLARVGAEYNLNKYFTVRAGIERLDLSSKNIDPRPTFGFSVTPSTTGFVPIIHYAFILEPIAPVPTHALSFTLNF